MWAQVIGRLLCSAKKEMKFDDVLHYELYFFVKRINQSICPSQYLLASTDDTTLWLTCFCSFSLVCSPLLLPVVHSLSIVHSSLYVHVLSRFGHQVQVPVSSSFSSLQYTSFSLPIWRTSPPFRQSRTSFFSPCLSLCFPLFLLSAHPRAPMKYTTKVQVPRFLFLHLIELNQSRTWAIFLPFTGQGFF